MTLRGRIQRKIYEVLMCNPGGVSNWGLEQAFVGEPVCGSSISGELRELRHKLWAEGRDILTIRLKDSNTYIYRLGKLKEKLI